MYSRVHVLPFRAPRSAARPVLGPVRGTALRIALGFALGLCLAVPANAADGSVQAAPTLGELVPVPLPDDVPVPAPAGVGEEQPTPVPSGAGGDEPAESDATGSGEQPPPAEEPAPEPAPEPEPEPAPEPAPEPESLVPALEETPDEQGTPAAGDSPPTEPVAGETPGDAAGDAAGDVVPPAQLSGTSEEEVPPVGEAAQVVECAPGADSVAAPTPDATSCAAPAEPDPVATPAEDTSASPTAAEQPLEELAVEGSALDDASESSASEMASAEQSPAEATPEATLEVAQEETTDAPPGEGSESPPAPEPIAELAAAPEAPEASIVESPAVEPEAPELLAPYATDVTPAEVYASVDHLARRLEALFAALERELPATPVALDQELGPHHVYQLHLALHGELRALAAERELFALPALASSPRQPAPRDVLFLVQLEHAWLDLLERDLELELPRLAPEPEADHTSAEVFARTSAVLAAVNALGSEAGFTSDRVFAEVVRASADVRAMLLESDPAARYSIRPGETVSSGREPSDVLARLVGARRDLGRLVAKAGLEAAPVPELPTELEVTPLLPFLETQVLIAELNALELRLGGSRATPPAVPVSGKTPTDVLEQVVFLEHLLGQLSVAGAVAAR